MQIFKPKVILGLRYNKVIILIETYYKNLQKNRNI